MKLEQRLARLERQNGRLKRGMIRMAVAGMSLLIMGQTLPPKVHDVVMAKKFEVIGKEGKRFVVLTSYSQKSTSGYGTINIYNEKRRPVITLNSFDGKGKIYVKSKLGRSIAALYAVNGAGVLSIGDSSTMRPKVYISSRNGNGSVSINGPKNRRKVTMGVSKSGRGYVRTQ